MTFKELKKLMDEVPEFFHDKSVQISLELDGSITKIPVVGIEYGFNETTSDLYVDIVSPIQFTTDPTFNLEMESE